MNSSVELRPGTAMDVEAMYALDLLCFTVPFQFDMRTMRRLACEAEAMVTVAERGDELVGFAIANLRRGKGEVRAYVSTLDVAPGERRGGLGRRLMEATERRCTEAGAVRMSLHVWTENRSALAFYEAAGYVRGELSVGYYREAGDAWQYGRRLEQ